MHETLFKLAVLDALRELIIALPNAPLNEHKQLAEIDRLIKFYRGERECCDDGDAEIPNGDRHILNPPWED